MNQSSSEPSAAFQRALSSVTCPPGEPLATRLPAARASCAGPPGRHPWRAHVKPRTTPCWNLLNRQKQSSEENCRSDRNSRSSEWLTVGSSVSKCFGVTTVFERLTRWNKKILFSGDLKKWLHFHYCAFTFIICVGSQKILVDLCSNITKMLFNFCLIWNNGKEKENEWHWAALDGVFSAKT